MNCSGKSLVQRDRCVIASIFLFASNVAIAANFATCLLDELPGIQNDSAAMATRQVCFKKFPEGFNGVEQGSGRGWFGYESGAACTAKLAAKTMSRQAGGLISFACNKLYDKPVFNPFDIFDPEK